MAIQMAAFGKAADMIAEYGAFDINAVCDTKYRYYAMPVGDEQYDTEGFNTEAECRSWAAEMAREYACTVSRI